MNGKKSVSKNNTPNALKKERNDFERYETAFWRNEMSGFNGQWLGCTCPIDS